MTFELTEEQQDIRTLVRDFLDDHYSTHVRRDLYEAGGLDRVLWKRLGSELGLIGLDLPTEYGGSGTGFAHTCVLMEELGRVLAPVPLLSSLVLAARALLASADEEACAHLLPGIASGELIATLAVAEGTDVAPRSPATRATCVDGAWSITGEKRFVTDAQHADVILVPAMTSRGVSLFTVEAGSPGLHIDPASSMDRSRPMATVTLEAASATLIGVEGKGDGAVQAALTAGAVALSAESVGGTLRALEMAVDFAGTRIAFGREIGSFQAIKHLLADCYVEAESARLAARHAAVCFDESPEEAPLLAALSKSFSAEAYWTAASTSIQVHGAIGFTWEYDAHLYFKRATVSRQLLGSTELHRERMAALAFDETKVGEVVA